MKLSIAPAVKENPTFFCSSLFDNYPTDLSPNRVSRRVDEVWR